MVILEVLTFVTDIWFKIVVGVSCLQIATWYDNHKH